MNGYEYFNCIVIYIENTSLISYSRCIAVVTSHHHCQKTKKYSCTIPSMNSYESETICHWKTLNNHRCLNFSAIIIYLNCFIRCEKKWILDFVTVFGTSAIKSLINSIWNRWITLNWLSSNLILNLIVPICLYKHMYILCFI